MNNAISETKIRPIALEDLKAIYSIDKEIRESREAITYEGITTRGIFNISQGIQSGNTPISYITKLLDFSFVAEIDGQICGFALGQTTLENDIKVGLLLMVGIRPGYRRKGIATQLINGLFEKCRSKDIKTLRATVDQQDELLLGFIEHMGFTAARRVSYSKTL